MPLSYPLDKLIVLHSLGSFSTAHLTIAKVAPLLGSAPPACQATLLPTGFADVLQDKLYSVMELA